MKKTKRGPFYETPCISYDLLANVLVTWITTTIAYEVNRHTSIIQIRL